MKLRIGLFLIAVFIITGLCAALAFRSIGRDCYGTYPTSFFSSKNKKIVEKYEWRGTDTLNPYIDRVGYESATIEGRIDAWQRTRGNGTVGVFPEGSVSGPNFSLTLPKEFNMRTAGYIVGQSDETNMHTKNSDTNNSPGPYTLTGSADFVGVYGGGGITVSGHGYRLSGPIQFETSQSATPQTLTLTVKQKRPSSHECAHPNCSVELPSRFFHRQPCQEKRWRSASKTEITCNRLYYRCQESTCPLDYLHVATHACGNHKDTKQGVRLNSSSHELQASCPKSITQDGTTVYCRVSNFYACEDPAHTCDFPPPSNNGNGGSGSTPTTPAPAPTPTPTPEPTLVTCGRSGCTQTVSSATEHQVTCAAGHQYWTCGQYANWLYHHHRVKTCKFSSCKQTWQTCTGASTPMCKAASRQGKKCWALP